MIGGVFSGVVVKTTTVLAVEGGNTTVSKSEIVHVEPPFIALSSDTAKAIVLANAIIKAKVNPNDSAAPVEVRLQAI